MNRIILAILAAALPLCAQTVNGIAGQSVTAISASNITTGTLPAAQLPSPTATTLGGVQSAAAVSNQFLDSISTAGVPHPRAILDADIPATLTGKTVDTATSSEIAFLSGVTSALQTQLNGKAATGAATTVNGVSCALSSTCTVADSTRQASAIVNTTPVSTVASNTSAQNLMTVSLPAGALNTAGKTLHVWAPATYTTGSGSSNGIQTWLLRLCSVSGCASGTVVNLVSIASATDVISTTNGRVEFEVYASTAATGATGNIEPHGHLAIVLATTATTPPTWYMDSNTAVSSSIDLTAAWFVQVSVTMATNGATTASSIATERQLMAEVK